MATLQRVVVVGNLDSLGTGRRGRVSRTFPGRFRVLDVWITATLPRSRVERLARRLPGVGRILTGILRDRDAEDRAWATPQVHIHRVTVGSHGYERGWIAKLPVVANHEEVSVEVANRCARPLSVRVFIEGVFL